MYPGAMQPNPFYAPLFLTDIKNRGRQQKRVSRAPWRIPLVLALLGLGICLIVLDPVNPYHKITGHIQKFYGAEQLIDDNASLQLDTAHNDLFYIEQVSYDPALPVQLPQGALVDVYYTNVSWQNNQVSTSVESDTGVVWQIGAIQMYSSAGHPTTEYTTADYRASLHISPLSNVWRDIGAILVLLSAILTAIMAVKFVRLRRQDGIILSNDQKAQACVDEGKQEENVSKSIASRPIFSAAHHD